MSRRRRDAPSLSPRREPPKKGGAPEAGEPLLQGGAAASGGRAPAWGCALLEGGRDALPLLVGLIPFGLVTGLSAVVIGLPKLEAIAMSAIVFAGAAQLAGLQLIGVGAPMSMILLTTLMINLRYALYSATLAPSLTRAPVPVRLLLAYLTTDPSFALATRRYRHDGAAERVGERVAYYLGVALPIWLVWMLATAAGALLGAELPADWSLEFAIPLAFMGLLFTVLGDRASVTAALVGASLALLGRGLPYNLGLVVASLAGVAAGALADAPRRGGEPGGAADDGP